MSRKIEKIELIQSTLKSIPPNTFFKDEVALILYLSPLTHIHRTNLKRNENYYKIIVEYLSTQKGAALFIKDEEADKYVLRAQLLAARIESAQLKKDIERLQRNISQFLSPNTSSTINKKQKSDVVQANEARDTEDNLLNEAAMAFYAVVKWVQDQQLGLSINEEEQFIEDLTCSYEPKRTVVSKRRAKFFFDFRRKNSILFKSIG